MTGNTDLLGTQYPWMDGFNAVVDNLGDVQSGETVNKHRILSGVGVYPCPDRICPGFSHSWPSIEDEMGYRSEDEADAYVQGAIAAVNTLTATTIVEETRYV